MESEFLFFFKQLEVLSNYVLEEDKFCAVDHNNSHCDLKALRIYLVAWFIYLKHTWESAYGKWQRIAQF